MSDTILRFFSTDGFMPHGMCYLWRPDILSLHVISDALIAASYFSIPFTLAFFMRRRKDLEFNWMIGCFAIFIVACGMTHVMEIVTIWQPYYWFSGTVKAITAAASVPTAVLLVKLMPQALRWPSPVSLQRANDELRHLQSITDTALSSESTETLIRAVLARLRAALHADTTTILLTDSDGEHLTPYASDGLEAELGGEIQIPIGRGVAGRIAFGEGPVILEDLTAIEAVSPILRKRVRSLVGIALRSSGHLIGVVHAGSSAPRRFTDDDARLLSLAADRIGTAIERARLHEAEQTARRAAETAARQKSSFLATASHDLRQPLQTLSLLNGSLRRMSPTREIARALAEQEEAIVAMSRLTNALLDISKLESGAVQPQVQDFAVESSFEELRTEFTGIAEKKGLALEISSGAEIAATDPILLGQVLRNLVSNAIRYTVRGRVRLRCERDGEGRLRIDVEDSGVGIAEDQLPHIFEEFYQVGVSPNSVREGHGLGLSIVQRAATLLGHELRVRSQLGCGTTFSIFVPAGSPERLQRAIAVPRAPAEAAARIHVLVVDDDTAVLNATRMLLQVEGFEVSAAATLADAVGMATEHKDIRILITDYHLGNGNLGTQVIDAVRSVLGQGLRAVLVSGDTSGAARPAISDPRVRLASKPVIAEELLQILAELAASVA